MCLFFSISSVNSFFCFKMDFFWCRHWFIHISVKIKDQKVETCWIKTSSDFCPFLGPEILQIILPIYLAKIDQHNHPTGDVCVHLMNVESVTPTVTECSCVRRQNQNDPVFLSLSAGVTFSAMSHQSLPPSLPQVCMQVLSSSSSTSYLRVVPSWGSGSTPPTSSGPIYPLTCSWRSAVTPRWTDGSVQTTTYIQTCNSHTTTLVSS